MQTRQETNIRKKKANGAMKYFAPQQRVVDFMTKNYPPDFTYPDFAPHFTANILDPLE